MRTRDKELKALFIGPIGGQERDLASRAGLGYVGITGGKFRRVPGLWNNLRSVGNLLLNLRDALLILIGGLQAIWVIGRFHPDVIFNKAGSVGIPVGIAAWAWHIPMVLHEPDVIPGWGNQLLSRWAAKIAVGFPPAAQTGLPQRKLVYTGTPVQPQMLGSSSSQEAKVALNFDPKKPVTLVVGGSLGAQAVNSMLLELLPELLEETQIQHVPGRYDIERVRGVAADKGIATHDGYRVDPILPVHEMGQAYAAADVVVARAGANTIAELAALKKVVILVPNRLAAAHQLANAEALAKAKAALVIPQEAKELGAALHKLLRDKSMRQQLSTNIAAFNRPEAAQDLAELLQSVRKGER